MKLISRNSDETEVIGFKLGKMLRAGDIVGLYGDLGAGKTTMVKGIARAFGIDSRDVTSASFTIIAEYQSSPPFFHIDLYRISGSYDLYSTGILDYIGGDSVSVIEWAEKAEQILPENTIKVMINDKGSDLREITIERVNEENWDNL